MQRPDRTLSAETAPEIDCAVRSIVSGGFERTVALLTVWRDVLETGAKQLLEKETLNEPELQSLRDALHASATSETVAVRSTG